MSDSERFNIGFLKVSGNQEHMFLSVTPGFEHGPGIQRDGITAPRMTDPHSVPFVCHSRNLRPIFGLEPTMNAFIQRSGTWTLYHHLKEFVDKRGENWQIIGVQSSGDLTMNPWHIAYIGDSHIENRSNLLCGLLTDTDPQERVSSRIYRCLVKWNGLAADKRGLSYEFLDLTLSLVKHDYSIELADYEVSKNYEEWLKYLDGYNEYTKNIAPLVEFVLSGKPIVEKGVELSLSNAIDRFQDIRHIFNLPPVKADGFFRGQKIEEINFGEYQLFENLNERRAALLSAVIIDLNPLDHVKVDWEELEKKLIERHFKVISESPTRRGQYRKYSDDIAREKVEVFFPHNVYPFGVLGMHLDEIVCLASGGLSGRVGNTLEGITRIMFDFFGSDDAMVLDEGYDTFQIVNPIALNGSYKYSNEELLAKILTFTKQMVDKEHQQSLKSTQYYKFEGGMKEWPLNKDVFALIDNDSQNQKEEDYSDVLVVRPHRSQMRSIIIFAVKTN